MASDPSPRPSLRQPSGQDACAEQPQTAAAVERHGRRRPGRLDLGDAIHDGWLAYCRAPRAFSAFALLVNLLILLPQPLLSPIGSVSRPSGDPGAWLLYALGQMLTMSLFLWGCVGLGRGSLLALQGKRPTLMQLLRWDGTAWQRLLRAWLRLVALVGVPSTAALLLFGVPLLVLRQELELQRHLGREATLLLGLTLAALLLLSLALTLVGLLYLLVNQALMLQIVLLEGRGGGAVVQRGRELVDPQWPLVLLLVLLMTILNGLGLLACGVGSVVAWPAVICISTAAYRQLRSSELQAGGGDPAPAEAAPAP